MANETYINPDLNSQTDSNATVINTFQDNNSTQINSELAASQIINPGTELLDGYSVVSMLDTQTGEANLFICEKEAKKYVAKVYRRKVAVKNEIINKLIDINSSYVAKVYATGEYNGFPVEIIPYYKNGSLEGKKYTYLELKKHIIPSLNEGLHILHENGIIHKDLKPSNIMLNDNQIDVAIIDFGISSIRDTGSTVVVTKTGMTPEYSAPETFRNLFLVESDYFSFGITIYELFTGKTPYSGMSSEDIEKYVAVQHIPFPDDMPDDLKNLISALTYNDITNRKNKSNPNRRWCYEEVKRWCNGDELVVPGEGIGNSIGSIAPYKFNGETYTDKAELVKALALNWEDGKKQLYRGLLSSYYKAIDPEMAGICMDAEEAVENGDDEDLTFFRLLYEMDENTENFMWKGEIFGSLDELGKMLLNSLWGEKKDLDPFIGGILGNRLLSEYCYAMSVEDEDIINTVKKLEQTYASLKNKDENRVRVYYLMAYTLSGEKIYNYKGEKFYSLNDITLYMRALLDNSYEDFRNFCGELMSGDGVLDAQFESWLISLGKQSEISNWRKSLLN